MVVIPITSADLYDISKSKFFRYIPHCCVNFVHGHLQMTFDMNMVAATHKRAERRKIVALALAYCSDELIDDFSKWLSDYFSEAMQIRIFDLTVDKNGKIVPGKELEKALNNLRKR